MSAEEIFKDFDNNPYEEEARQRWGVAAVLNTSMNIHGEPLVCTPAQAVDVFLRSGADAIAIGPYCIETADTARTVPVRQTAGATP